MDRNKLLMAVAAVALIAGSSGASAQTEPSRTAPAEKTAPKTPAGELHQNSAPSGGAARKGEPVANPKAAEERSEQTKPKEPRAAEQKKLDGKASDGKASDGKASEEKASSQDNDRNHATTGQAASPGKGADITPENRTRMHQAFTKEHSAPKVDHVDFGLSVGTAVPHSVRIVVVPETIIEIQPTWRGYEYFMVGDQIVIVDPRSMEIVAILDV
jgi:Protein of unknown function (DUF1236)